MEICIFVEPEQGFTTRAVLAAAGAAEALGFHGFFTSDHLLRIGDGPAAVGSRDAWVLLALAAARTKSIKLGSLLSPVTFRHPGQLAAAVATAAEESEGRCEVGVGAGWYRDEHRAFGIPFPGAAERFELLEDHLAVLKGLWSLQADSRLDFKGFHYRLEGCPSPFHPSFSYRPPLITGGLGKVRTPDLAARYADEMNVPPAGRGAAEDCFELVREACRRLGRQPSSLRLSAGLVVCCGRSRRAVQERMDKVCGSIGYTPPQIREQGGAGSPEMVLERLSELRAAGAGRAYLQIIDLADLDHLQLLAEEVLPESSRF